MSLQASVSALGPDETPERPDRIAIPPGFRTPDPQTMFDLHRQRAGVPAHATVKGMFFNAMVDEVKARGEVLRGVKPVAAFHDFPLTGLLDLYEEAAGLCYGDLTLYEGMRRLSRPAFEVFSDSLIGKVVFGAVGRDVSRILKLSARAWGHATNVGTLEVERLDGHAALIRVDEFHLGEPVAVGIAEGVLQAAGRTGTVALRMSTPLAGEFWLHWE